MKFNPSPLEGVFLIEQERRGDDRGFFARAFCEREFEEAGIESRFVQINNSLTSRRGTLRGLTTSCPRRPR
jgi:dTDP-4-dehydrorhamnose 3,5-epimerase